MNTLLAMCVNNTGRSFLHPMVCGILYVQTTVPKCSRLLLKKIRDLLPVMKKTIIIIIIIQTIDRVDHHHHHHHRRHRHRRRHHHLRRSYQTN